MPVQKESNTAAAVNRHRAGGAIPPDVASEIIAAFDEDAKAFAHVIEDAPTTVVTPPAVNVLDVATAIAKADTKLQGKLLVDLDDESLRRYMTMAEAAVQSMLEAAP